MSDYGWVWWLVGLVYLTGFLVGVYWGKHVFK